MPKKPTDKPPSQLWMELLGDPLPYRVSDSLVLSNAYDDRPQVKFLHTVMAQTSMPYRDPGDAVREWHRKNGRVWALMTAGSVVDTNEEVVRIGLPFGTKPRLVMAHLNTIALRTGKNEIETENTLTGFVSHTLGLDTGGRNLRTVREQITRLAATRVQFAILDDGRVKHVDGQMMDSFDLWAEGDGGDRVLWPTHLRLSPTYFASLQRHAVPLAEDHLRHLSHSAMALDIYSWLSQRLHRTRVGEPESITWDALHGQFGVDFARTRKFVETFREALRQVKAVYPAARVEEETRKYKGLRLYNSPPPVPKAMVPVLWDGVERRSFPRKPEDL